MLYSLQGRMRGDIIKSCHVTLTVMVHVHTLVVASSFVLFVYLQSSFKLLHSPVTCLHYAIDAYIFRRIFFCCSVISTNQSH